MPASRLPREARRAQLIEAGSAAFLGGGYECTSMEDVAQAAGVSRLILYRIFSSKEELYRAILRQVLVALGDAFAGLSFDDVAEQGAATVMMPVARANPDAFRLLWRDAWHQPPFEGLAEEFRTYVSVYARAIISRSIDDERLLDWAAHTAGAHLIDGICRWLDAGDPALDAQHAERMSAGMRALVRAWAEVG